MDRAWSAAAAGGKFSQEIRQELELTSRARPTSMLLTRRLQDAFFYLLGLWRLLLEEVVTVFRLARHRAAYPREPGRRSRLYGCFMAG